MSCLSRCRKLTRNQDSDTNPNTTASSVAGDAAPADGRKRRTEVFNMRKSIYGKKHDRLAGSKVYLAFVVAYTSRGTVTNMTGAI